MLEVYQWIERPSSPLKCFCRLYAAGHSYTTLRLKQGDLKFGILTSTTLKKYLAKARILLSVKSVRGNNRFNPTAIYRTLVLTAFWWLSPLFRLRSYLRFGYSIAIPPTDKPQSNGSSDMNQRPASLRVPAALNLGYTYGKRRRGGMR